MEELKPARPCGPPGGESPAGSRGAGAPAPRRWLWGLTWVVVLFFCAMTLRSLFGRGDAGARGRVAIVNVTGVLINTTHQVDLIRRYRNDDSIGAIVLRIDTPGGSIAAVQEMTREVQAARASGKLVVASLGNVAASGGYYLAASADHIVADPGTLTGSIGVIITFANYEELMKKIGVRLDVIKSGPYKDAGSPARTITKRERELLQDVIDDMHAQFVEAIVAGRAEPIRQVLAEARRIAPDAITTAEIRHEVEKVADGRVFSGLKAKALGLVDELGNFHDAVQAAAQRAGIPGTPELVTERKPFSLLDYLIGGKMESALQAMGDWVPIRYQLAY